MSFPLLQFTEHIYWYFISSWQNVRRTLPNKLYFNLTKDLCSGKGGKLFLSSKQVPVSVSQLSMQLLQLGVPSPYHYLPIKNTKSFNRALIIRVLLSSMTLWFLPPSDCDSLYTQCQFTLKTNTQFHIATIYFNSQSSLFVNIITTYLCI